MLAVLLAVAATIASENQRPGATDWEITRPALGREIEGYASRTSGNAAARKVSLNRPYAANPYGVRLDGAGDFLRRWEYNAVRFLEREGYDVSYTTDVDTHERPIAGDGSPAHRIFLSVGHDEYWSWAMREHVESARDRGVHLAFLGADVC